MGVTQLGQTIRYERILTLDIAHCNTLNLSLPYQVHRLESLNRAKWAPAGRWVGAKA